MAWVVRPPETVKVGEVFGVTYSVTAGDSFYRWAVRNHIFPHRCVILVPAGHADRLLSLSSGLNRSDVCLCVQLSRDP